MVYLYYYIIKEIPVLNVISVDLDQTTRSVSFDLDLHYMPISLLGDARYKCVTLNILFSVFCFFFYFTS